VFSINSVRESLRGEKQAVIASTTDDKLKVLQAHLKRSVENVKEQFEDHLEAINENTNEIQSNFEYICELDRKIDKLGERIDEIAQLIREQKGQKPKKFELQPLTKKEKEVFYAIYILTEHRKFTTYKAVSRRVCYSEELVAAYITSLIQKGVPVLKRYENRTAYISLDYCFRQLQAKENIVGVNTLLTHWV